MGSQAEHVEMGLTQGEILCADWVELQAEAKFKLNASPSFDTPLPITHEGCKCQCGTLDAIERQYAMRQAAQLKQHTESALCQQVELLNHFERNDELRLQQSAEQYWKAAYQKLQQATQGHEQVKQQSEQNQKLRGGPGEGAPLMKQANLRLFVPPKNSSALLIIDPDTKEEVELSSEEKERRKKLESKARFNQPWGVAQVERVGRQVQQAQQQLDAVEQFVEENQIAYSTECAACRILISGLPAMQHFAYAKCRAHQPDHTCECTCSRPPRSMYIESFQGRPPRSIP